MYSYYKQPSLAHCYGLSKIISSLDLSYLDQYPAALQDIAKSLGLVRQLENYQYLLESNINFKDRLNKGYSRSSQLLETPKFSQELYLFETIIESCLITEQTGEQIKANLNTLINGKKYKFNWVLTQDNPTWWYIYSYWLRRGFNVREVKGEYFLITEPLGKQFRIESYRCSCEWGMKEKRCLHLQLIHWYRETRNH